MSVIARFSKLGNRKFHPTGISYEGAGSVAMKQSDTVALQYSRWVLYNSEQT